MLNNEAGKVNKSIRMDFECFPWFGYLGWCNRFLNQRLVWSIVDGVTQVVYKQCENVKINHPRSTGLINAEKIKE